MYEPNCIPVCMDEAEVVSVRERKVEAIRTLQLNKMWNGKEMHSNQNTEKSKYRNIRNRP